MQFDNDYQCAECEREFGEDSENGGIVELFGSSDFCVECVDACAGAVTIDHCCMVCMDVVM